MNDLTTFQFQPEGVVLFQPIRTVTISGDPWFVARDVCDVLGLENVAMALRRLDDDEKRVNIVDTPGGVQSVSIISKIGLYALELTSNKQTAKDFGRWIRKSVLPAIRKAGSYVKGERFWTTTHRTISTA